ncbi:MAG: glycosyltransferase family 2 protein [Candidatus Gastranaerophilaceae bacterium]|jgi:GT2 family glycosyltransferase
MASIKTTIIILDFLKGRQVVKNVESLLAQITEFSFKIIVIDNSCNQANAEILEELRGKERVTLHINQNNLGYTRAHNQVKGEVEGDYVFIVNPDIEWTNDNSIQEMITFLEANQSIGVLGPKQVNKDGQTAMTIRAFPKIYLQVARRTFLRNLPLIDNQVSYDEMRHLDYEKIQDVDWLQSSCVAVRRKLWEEIGGLNERYFLFMSDVELCFDTWEKGFRVVYYPSVVVGADGKRVSAGGFKHFFKSWVMRQHLKDSIKYRLKHIFDQNPRSKYYNNIKKHQI